MVTLIGGRALHEPEEALILLHIDVENRSTSLKAILKCLI